MFAHVDADAFFASVLVRQNPQLRGKPLLALGMGGGCVISASYEAKAKGVKTGMRLSEARKLCPEAIGMPSDFAETGRASEAIETILGNICPFMEQMSIDEWFLDVRACVGGVPNDVDAWAVDLRKKVLNHTGLSVSAGVGPTKILAKMASEYRKPGGVTVVTLGPHPGSAEPPLSSVSHDSMKSNFASPLLRKERGLGGEALSIETFLKDRPAAAIPGIGRKRVQATNAYHWNTAWDLTQAPEALLKKLFGIQGPELQKELLGNAVYSLVTSPAPPKSVSRARSFIPSKDRATLWAHTVRHMEYLVLKMRRHGLCCGGISLWLRDKEYTGFNGASRSWENPRDTESTLQEPLTQCFNEIYEPGKAYTQVGAALWRLTPKGAEQFSLFTTPEEVEAEQALQTSLDQLHERFGRSSITRGSALGVKTGTKQQLEFSTYE